MEELAPMKTNEVLHQLKNLPEDTLLTTEHIIGLVQVLKPLLNEKQQDKETDYDAFPNSKLINEKMLSDWLCESVHTIRKWREKGIGPKFVKSTTGSVRYQVGTIREWIDSHVYVSTTEYDYRNRK